ncbi:hypothetical protein HG531_001551 [Fusarium graminearum]|nr:hypothetical protein HG531_001551 [Fusarium graminearum]
MYYFWLLRYLSSNIANASTLNRNNDIIRIISNISQTPAACAKCSQVSRENNHLLVSKHLPTNSEATYILRSHGHKNKHGLCRNLCSTTTLRNVFEQLVGALLANVLRNDTTLGRHNHICRVENTDSA